MLRIRHPQTRLLSTLVLALALVEPTQADSEVFAKTVQATGFVVVPKENGQLGYGTGWVVDRANRLLITNVHVVRAYDHVGVYFPAWNNGRLITWSGDLIRKHSRIPGRVLARDRKRDLALVQLQYLPSYIGVLSLADKSPAKDQPVFSVGNSGMNQKPLNAGRLWTFRTGSVKQILFYRTRLKGTDIHIESRHVLTDSGIAPGDSGGPLVDAEGRLVGVVSHFNPAGSYAIEVSEVRAFLDRASNRKPLPASPIAGSWTVTFKQKDQERYFSLTFGPDGTVMWEASKSFAGTYTYQDDKLTLTVPSLGIRNQTYDLVWVDKTRFTFVRLNSEHTANRR